jgi:hypothetical protein
MGDVTPLIKKRDGVGSFGTASYSGYATEEYLTTLRGRKRADLFDQMRRSDPQVKMCLSSVKNPIKGALWEIEPADDTPEAQADADLIQHILFKDLNQDWVDFIGEALSMVDFGHCVFEVIHKAVIDHKKFGSYNGVKSLAFRSQRTLERWNLDSATGELQSVAQYAYGDLEAIVDIPSENLLVFSLEKEGANYEGISALRPCYGPWWRKNNYLKLNAVGIERFAVPTPLVKVPQGHDNSEQMANMTQAMEHYTNHQNNYLFYPEGWEVNVATSTYDPEKVENSVDKEDQRMVKAFLANFLELGMNGSGAYALSNDLSDFFLAGLDHIATKIEGVLNKHLIPMLIKMNRGERDAYPILKHSDISDKAGKELAEILKYLGGDTEFIIADDAMEAHLRKRYKLPKPSEIGQRKKAAASPYGYGGSSPQPTTPAPKPMTLMERMLLAEARRERILDGATV